MHSDANAGPKRRGRLFAVGLSLLLAACATKTSVAPDRSVAREATILLDIRIRASDRPLPRGLIVGVDDNFGDRQFAFGPNTRDADGDADFLVRLELPPGRYRILRVAGVDGRGVIDPGHDVRIDLPVEARDRSTVYLGRLEIAARPTDATAIGAPAFNVSITDRYRDDFVAFARAWPGLRQRDVTRWLAVSDAMVDREVPKATPAAPRFAASGLVPANAHR